MYAHAILSSAGYKVNNANPKASISPSAVQGKVPDEVFQKYQRAENATANSIEQLPLYAVAVLASIVAERVTAKGLRSKGLGEDVTGLASFVGAFMAVRAGYMISYIGIADHSKSFIRSSFWAVGVGLTSWQIYKAASLLG